MPRTKPSTGREPFTATPRTGASHRGTAGDFVLLVGTAAGTCTVDGRRLTHAARGLVAGAGLGLSSLGCATAIVPPPAPPDPRPVFLLDHGRHSSLVLPTPEGGAVRYAYGDWNYYALRRTGLLQALPALLWPTRAGLGRRELAGPAEAEAIRRQVRVGIERLYRIVVSAGAVDRLRARLDGIYESRRHTRVYNAAYDLEFVHHPRPYWGFHNSNQVVASWLEALGCDVRGLGLFSRWKVEPPDSR
jgi:hypothetical protein